MKRNLLIATAVWLALQITGVAVGIVRDLPRAHPLFGSGDPDPIAGTALSGPLAMLLVAVVAAILLTRDRPLSTGGVVGLALIGFLGTIGVLGEPITWESVEAGSFDLVQATQAWGSVVAGMFMWSFAVAETIRVRQETGDVRLPAEPAAREPRPIAT